MLNELAFLAVVACPSCYRGGGPDAKAYMWATLLMMAVPTLLGLGFYRLFRTGRG